MSAQLTSTRPVTVFIAARHERVRSALWSLLSAEPGIQPVAATADYSDLMRLLERVAPAVVVADESVFGCADTGRLPALAQVAPGLVVVGLQDHPGFVTRAREAGATDYVRLDEPERLAAAVLEADGGSARLIGP